MRSTNEPSVSELRRESERTRAELTRTVGDLREKVGDTASEIKARVSPENIKQEIRGYVRESRESIMDSLQDKVRENPLQAVAVGAAVAYPLLGLLRAIPAPLLLVGAGLWFAGTQGKKTVAEAQVKAANLVEPVRSSVSHLADAAKNRAQGLAETAEAALGLERNQAVDTATRLADSVATGAQQFTDKARTNAHDIQDAVARGVASISETISENAQNAADRVTETASNAKAKVRDSANTLVDLVERNPLLVAGVGLAVGAFVAASLPPSETENRLFGGQADGLKDQARDLASQGIDRVRGAASEIVDDISDAAAREGFSSEGISKTVDQLTKGAKAVAERGLEAAMGSAVPPSSETPITPRRES